MTNEQSDAPTGATVNITFSGTNSRLNIGSADQSKNVISTTAESHSIFTQLQQLISPQIQSSDRTSCLKD